MEQPRSGALAMRERGGGKRKQDEKTRGEEREKIGVLEDCFQKIAPLKNYVVQAY